MKGMRFFYKRDKVTLFYILFFPLLILLSGVYFVFLSVIKLFYRLKVLRAYRSHAKVISIGNITLGGSGKTPFAAYMAEIFAERGLRPAILLRGYKKPKITGVLGAKDYYMAGDEASMLKEDLKGKAEVVVGKNRLEGARRLDEEGVCDVLILDDGFQHWRLKRDLDIVTVDATNPFGRKALLPAGHLREGLASLGRADCICLTHSDEVSFERLNQLESFMGRRSPTALFLRAVHAPSHFADLKTLERLNLDVLRGEDVCLFCGIASPESLLRSVERLGAHVVWMKCFDDHHEYQERELQEMIENCQRFKIPTLVTTHKDAQRLRNFVTQRELNARFLVLKIEFKIVKGEEALDERLADLFRC